MSSREKISTTFQDSSSIKSQEKALSKEYFSIWKILLPVFIGLTVVILMLIHDARNENIPRLLSSITFDAETNLFIFLSFSAVFAREFGLTWRFKILTDGRLSWKQAFDIDMLCEFTSCITPTAVGGSSMGMFFLNSKGIEFGKATTLMMTTLFLDEFFFLVFCPIIVLITPGGELFATGDQSFSVGLRWSFWSIYGLISLWAIILFIGVIIHPYWIKKVLNSLFRLKWLRKWERKIDSLTTDMIETSKNLRKRSYIFWIKNFSATTISWFGRFLVVNMLFMAFIPDAAPKQWVIFAREFVIWVVLMVSPTPGGSGLSEWLFSSYYGDLVSVAGIALILAIFWRMLSYYIYLIYGACIVPAWIKNTYKRIKTPAHNKR